MALDVQSRLRNFVSFPKTTTCVMFVTFSRVDPLQKHCYLHQLFVILLKNLQLHLYTFRIVKLKII